MFLTKKSLGQNFLVNKKIYQFMVEEIAPQKGEVILEVGPGEGILTSYLAQSEAEIMAVEKDRRLIPVLKEKFKNQKNVTIVEEDILKLKFIGKSAIRLTLDFRLFAREFSSGCMADLPDLKIDNYKVVGNIPYYITSHLLRIALEEWPKPKLILFMVPKEVAQRIVAKPLPRRRSGQAPMSLLALAVQFFAEAKIIKNVSKNNFRPVPKVDSALVKIVPKTVSYAKEFQKKFFELAQAAFRNKRKQILNTLGEKFDKDLVVKKLAEAKVDPTRRPETLSLAEWEKLTKLLFSDSLSD